MSFRKLFFPLFLLRLSLLIAPFFIKAAIVSFNFSLSLLFSLLFLIFQLSFYLGNIYLEKTSQEQLLLLDLFHKRKQSYLVKQESYWLSFYEKQPTHRDVLLNLATISCQLDKAEKCNHYWQQAKYIDPNNPLLKEKPF